MHRHWHRITRSFAPPLAVAAATCIAGCGGGSSASTQQTSPGGATSAATSAAPTGGAPIVKIQSFMFAPATITVKRATSVTFANKDNASHTATADGASFDSGTLTQGASKQITFSQAGRFTYHCAFHPFMHGTIVVQ